MMCFDMNRRDFSNQAIHKLSKTSAFQRAQLQQPHRTHSRMVPSLLEPTPIDTGKMIPVENVPLFQSIWNGDDRLLLALQGILSQTQASQLPVVSASNSVAQGSQSSYQVSMGKALPTSSNGAVDPFCLSDQLADPAMFRCTQLEQWNLRYGELVQFRNEHKHCSVPLNYVGNPSLAHWVKRQRHQYRMKIEGKHSTLTSDRQNVLNKLGFVWDSHAAAWEERWNQLREFREAYGHSRVPKNYPKNQQLVSTTQWKQHVLSRALSHTLCSSFSFRLFGSNAKEDNSSYTVKANNQICPKTESKSYSI